MDAEGRVPVDIKQAQKIANWVAANNPSLDEIDKRADASSTNRR
jgi:hypothetical protein